VATDSANSRPWLEDPLEMVMMGIVCSSWLGFKMVPFYKTGSVSKNKAESLGNGVSVNISHRVKRNIQIR
jgi:hypothetical protein